MPAFKLMVVAEETGKLVASAFITAANRNDDLTVSIGGERVYNLCDYEDAIDLVPDLIRAIKYEIVQSTANPS